MMDGREARSVYVGNTGTGMDEDSREPSVRSAVQRVEMEVEALANDLLAVIEKLSPILSPERPVPEAAIEAKVSNIDSAPHAMHLNAIALRVNDVHSTLLRMMRRVEV